MSTSVMLERASALSELIRAEAAAAEQRRRLTDPVVSALLDADIFRMCVPAVYSGPEVDPITMVRVVECLAHADGAAGWCANIAATTSTMSWYLSPHWASEIYGRPVATGGAFNPTGRATTTDDGWLCEGRWAWGSGSQHCAWLTAGCVTDTGDMHTMFVPAADVGFVDNWYSSGLKGTGSTDFTLSGVTVPFGRSVRPGIDGPQVDCALARFPNMSLLAAGVAASALGIASRAIEELELLAGKKRPAFSTKSLAEHVPAQMAISRATAAHRSARAFLHEALHDAWASVVADGRATMADRSAIRLAAANAAEAAITVVDLCHRSGGGTAVYDDSPLQKCLRDAHTASAHIMISDRNLITYGRLRLDLPADTSLW
jgi:indole-3-acetate monooxygenase